MVVQKEPTAALLAQLHVCIRHILAHKGMSIDVKKVVDGYPFSGVASISHYLRGIAQRSPILSTLSVVTATPQLSPVHQLVAQPHLAVPVPAAVLLPVPAAVLLFQLQQQQQQLLPSTPVSALKGRLVAHSHPALFASPVHVSFRTLRVHLTLCLLTSLARHWPLQVPSSSKRGPLAPSAMSRHPPCHLLAHSSRVGSGVQGPHLPPSQVARMRPVRSLVGRTAGCPRAVRPSLRVQGSSWILRYHAG